MVYIFLCFKYLFTVTYFLFLKLCYGSSFLYKGRLQTLSLPRIRIRDGGKILLSQTKFRDNCSIFSDGGSITVGIDSFMNNGCSINSMGEIQIGERTLFGEGVKLYDHNHKIIDTIVQHKSFEVSNVKIGNDCWIGSNCIILPGVTIADKVVIGAGAIVTKSIIEPGIYVPSPVGLRKIR